MQQPPSRKEDERRAAEHQEHRLIQKQKAERRQNIGQDSIGRAEFFFLQRARDEVHQEEQHERTAESHISVGHRGGQSRADNSPHNAEEKREQDYYSDQAEPARDVFERLQYASVKRSFRMSVRDIRVAENEHYERKHRKRQSVCRAAADSV